MNLNWKILHIFCEGRKNEDVVWYETDFNDCLNGESGHTGHLEINTHFAIVKSTIEDPDEVKADKGYKNRSCYYKWFCGGFDFPNNHMKVVIERTWYGKLKVVTAYFTASLHSGEKTIWTKI